MEEKEVEQEMVSLDKEVEYMVDKKLREFSFEINEDLIHVPEEEELDKATEKIIEEYKMARKLGMGEEAMKLKLSIKEMKFAKEHLIKVMNMDFKRPTKKMREMVKESKIDLNDPLVIEEFKLIQQQTLSDIQRIKDGKPPLTEEEMKKRRQDLHEKRH